MSSVSLAYADQKSMDTILLDQNKIVHDQNFHKQTVAQNKLVTLSLSESLGVKSNDDSSAVEQESHAVVQTYHMHNIIALSENLGITTSSFDQHLNLIAKQNSERITTAERISNLDRIRSAGKYLQNNELVGNQLNSFDKVPLVNYLNDQSVGLDYALYVDQIISKFSLDMSNDISTLFMEINLPVHEIQNLYDKSSGDSNNLLLILLIPFSGYLLIRSENPKLKISNKNRILSFCFIAILVSSAAVTPISVSPAFLQLVYAETMNDTNSDSSSDTTPNTNDSHIAFQFSNATNFVPSNQSSTVVPSFSFSNATNFVPSNQSSTVVPSFSFSNATTPTPTPTESWNFTDSNLKTMTVGKARMDDSENTTALSLNGDGYLKQNSTATQNLSALTLSAWVKPDYSQGSPQFTVISKENTFILAVNNNIQPAKKAVFSVFDGIKWNTVESNSTIPENWTHLVATYDGSSIGIYVNGTQESKIPLVGVSTISIHGTIENQTIGTLSSNSDVVIGAYMNSIRNNANNLFSGSLRDVKLYDSLLAPYQITGLYLGNNKQLAPITENATLAVLPQNSTVPAQNHSSLSDTISMNDAIQTLLSSAALTNNINGTNSTGINDTSSLPVVPTITNLKSSYMMSESPEFEFKIFKDSDIKKIKKTVIQSMQQDKWSEKNTTISIKVIAPDGTEIPIKSQFKKMKEGQFDIKLVSGRYGKPGMYTIKTTLVKNGKTYDTQSQYAWGLVSLNTEKSIYQPGDTANLIIAVLANNGSSVCDANIVMKITDPSSHDTILATPDDITSKECGLYNAPYVTNSEGNYTVDVTAKSYSGVSHFSTYFMVEKNFAYDIVRTTNTKIDPFDNPNIFNVKINVKSFVGAGQVTIREYVPNVLNVTTDGTVSQSGDTKIITWKRNLDANNSTYVTYAYSVPLIQPELYALGKVTVDQNNQPTFSEARNWYVAVDATRTMTFTLSPVAMKTDANINSNVLEVCNGASCTLAACTLASINANTCKTSGSNTFTFSFHFDLTVTTTSNYNYVWSSTASASCNPAVVARSLNDTTDSANCTTTGTYHKVFSISLTDSLGLADTVSNTKSLKRTLTDSLGMSDTVSTFKSFTKSLSDSLGLSDTLSTKKSLHTTLSDSLGLSDTVSTTKSLQRTLSDSLGLSDIVSNTKSLKRTLTDSLGLADTIATTRSANVALSDSLGMSDTIATTKSLNVALSDSLGMSDTIATTKSLQRTLTDSLGLSDTVSTFKSFTKSLTDSLGMSDTIATTKSLNVALSDSLGLSDTVTSVKSFTKLLSDSLGLSDTISTTKSFTKSLSDSLGMSDTIATTKSLNVALSDSLGLSDITETSKSINLSLQESMNLLSSMTPAKNLAPDQDLVENSQTQVTVNPAKPQLVIVDSSAALSQITVPSTVTNPTINYSSITQTSGSAVSVQITNQLNITKDTNGGSQTAVKVTIPANTNITGTSWNGVLDLPTIQSSANLNFPVASGQVATPQVVINLGSSTPLTFNQPVRLLLAGQAGSHVGFFHNTSTVTEITATCTSDGISGMPSGANECKINVGSDLIVWTKHFTGFGTWSSSSSSSSTSSAAPAASASSGAGGGAVGAGPSSGQSGPGGSIGQGGILPELKILDVSYDTCDTNTVKILVAYSDNNPSVILRTSITGVVQAVPAKEQPFAAENENATTKRLVYQASINSKEQTFEVLALQAVGHNIYSVGKTIDVTQCHDEISFENEQAIVPIEVDTSAPRIFDAKFQLDNGTKILSSEDNHVINSGSITVYAIMDSKTSLDDVELRFAKTGDFNYNTVKMNVTPLQISNSTYLVSGTISKDAIQAPAISYWITVHNSAGKTVSSDVYSIGVKPSYPVVGNLDLDTKMARIEGTTAHPTAYYTNNSTGPVYGRVVLLVNGTVSYVSPSQVFAPGQSVVNLQWKTPTVGKTSQYQLQARAEIFGKSIDTVSWPVTTFPGTAILPLSTLVNVSDISVGNTTIAKASTLYSSFKNDGTMNFKVTASDGTCVIGASDSCLVTQSTLGLAGNFKTVTVGDQVYRVRYTGSDDPLERFSITSVDSMSGNWKVEIDSASSLLPMAHAMDDVALKVKYRAVELPFVTENQ